MAQQIEKTIKKWTEIYEADKDMDFRTALEEIKTASVTEEENVYAANLKLLQSMGQYLPKHYRACGLPEELAADALEDLCWKTRECEKLYGVTGTFCAEWQWRFFNVTRFTLGRLQFEQNEIPMDLLFMKGLQYRKYSKVIGVHIPSSGKLDHGECLDAYRNAMYFFKYYFHVESLLFHCNSWLLTPEHEEILPPDSNILKLQKDYRVYRFEPGYDDLWRIFCREYDGKPENLPEETSLQRIYKKWIINGGTPGHAKGILNPENLFQY